MKRINVRGCRAMGPSRWSSVTLLILALTHGSLALGQDVAKQTSPSLRVTHLLGFENARKNSKGVLVIQPDALELQTKGRPSVQVKITSIDDIYIGEQSKQVGGKPMLLGKAAIPYSGGRLVSLFAHKKNDTLTVEYLDAAGDFHGAVFELNRGHAERLRNELVARGARVSAPPAKQTTQIAEASNEKK